MIGNSRPSLLIDLNEFKLQLHLKGKPQLTLHFHSPSRRFYLSVIALVVNEMKKSGKIKSIPLPEHLDLLALLNETIGGAAGSSKKENLLPRIYRKWKDALPNLEEAPLFKVLGKRKEEGDGSIAKVYSFSDVEKDGWANLFEYMGSEENVRLKFAIDKIGISLDETSIIFRDFRNGEAWDKFIASLRKEGEEKEEPAPVEETAAQEPPAVQFFPPQKRKISWLFGYRSVMLVVLLGMVAAGIWKIFLSPAPMEVASVDRMKFPLPDEPSIAVLPFVNLSEDPKQEFLSAGMTEAIITALSRLPRMLVIARTSTSVYKGKPVTVKAVSEELGVRYVLEGSVQRSGDRIRINAQLIDALTGYHLFSERYDRELKNIFAIQDEISMKILTATRVALTQGEEARVFDKGTKNIEAYLKVMQAREYHEVYTKESQAMARQLAEEAITLDPGYALAYSYAAHAIAHEVWLGVRTNPREALQRGMNLVQKAVALDDSLAHPHEVLSKYHIMMNQDYDRAINEAERAITLEPNSVDAHTQLGQNLRWAGRFAEAIPILQKATRLSPIPPHLCLLNLALCYNFTGQYEEAIALHRKILQKDPTQLLSQIGLTVALMQEGKEDEARTEAAKVLRIDPQFSLERFGKIVASTQKGGSVVDKYINALRKAGLK